MREMSQKEIARDLFDECARLKGLLRNRKIEIERLRASMKRIRSLTAAETCDESEALDQIFTIARAALGEDGKG